MSVNVPPSKIAFELAEAVRHLSECDERLKVLIEELAPFQIEYEDADSPYEILLESIAYQSISGKAAATIYGRIKALGENGRPPTPEKMLRIPATKLRKAGLSGAKVAAVKDLAKKTLEGIVPTLEEAQKLSDQELVDRLISVRGIGAWTVEMFLIFVLNRTDVLPVDDFGLRGGFVRAYGLRKHPTARRMVKMAESWRPYRSLGTWYLWRQPAVAKK